MRVAEMFHMTVAALVGVGLFVLGASMNRAKPVAALGPDFEAARIYACAEPYMWARKGYMYYALGSRQVPRAVVAARESALAVLGGCGK